MNFKNFISFIAFLIFSQSNFAQTDLHWLKRKAELDAACQEADAVVYGKIIEKDCSIYNMGSFECRFDIDVMKVLKGNVQPVKDIHLEFDSTEMKEVEVNLIFLEKNIADIALIEFHLKREKDENKRRIFVEEKLRDDQLQKESTFIFFLKGNKNVTMKVAHQPASVYRLIDKKFLQFELPIRQEIFYLERKK